jgi:hypothetical protein
MNENNKPDTTAQNTTAGNDETQIPVLPWDVLKVEEALKKVFDDGSEVDLLAILKENSFLFYDLYSRKWEITPIFREISFGGDYKADFLWLNDNSSGPEWVLVEIEKPKMNLFTKKGYPAAPLNNAVEQMKSWSRYFQRNPLEAKRIFGAVAKFRYILVAGDKQDWETETAMHWRAQFNKENGFSIEIRSMGTFLKSLEIVKTHSAEMWSFAEKPVTLASTALEPYWKGYDYMDRMRLLFA